MEGPQHVYGTLMASADQPRPQQNERRRVVAWGGALILAAMVVGGVAGVANGYAAAAHQTTGATSLSAETTAAGGTNSKESWLTKHSLANRNLTTAVVDGVEYVRLEVDLTSSDVIADFARRTPGAQFPDAIEILWNANLTDGEIGEQASEGFVAFNLANGDFATGNITASYTVVMDLTGAIIAAQVAPEVAAGVYERYEALKLKEAGVLLLGANSELSGNGYYLWDYLDAEPLPLSSQIVGSSHDIQYVKRDDAYLVIANTLDMVRLYNSKGQQIWEYVAFEKFAPGPTLHINHAQLTQDEDGNDIVVLSLRDYDSIQKLNYTSGEQFWKVGGHDSTYDVVDSDGQLYPAGSGRSPWNHQHNAEYIGSNRYAMFDNAYNNTKVRSSRYVIVDVNETTHSAEVVWEWSTGVNSLIFGDADPLPTGNVIGNFWSSTVHPRGRDVRKTYETAIAEVTLEGDIAWMLGVKGTNAPKTRSYERVSGEAPVGWAIYSVERFYDQPIVGQLSYDSSSFMLQFQLFDTYRQQVSGSSRVFLECGETTTSLLVHLQPHWQTSSVQLQLDNTTANLDCWLNVTTIEGQSRNMRVRPSHYDGVKY